MPAFDVLTLGTATRDVFLESPLFKVVEDEEHLKKLGFPTGQATCFAFGGKIEIAAPVLSVGGGAANAAVTFARQGYKTASIFKIGNDDAGRSVLSDMKSEGVTSFPVFDKKAMTAYSTILLSEGGERTILNHRGASEDLKKTELNLQKIKAKALYIVPGRIPWPVIQAAIDWGKKNKCLMAMNPSKFYLDFGLQKLSRLLNQLDVVILNREEAAYLTNRSYDQENEIFKILDKAVKGIVVMTDGPKGVTVSDGQKIYHAGTYIEKKIIDRTGAGDSFGSGFVSGLLRTKGDIHYAIRLGSANGTSVVESIGAQPGILTKSQFETSKRWKTLKIDVRN